MDPNDLIAALTGRQRRPHNHSETHKKVTDGVNRMSKVSTFLAAAEETKSPELCATLLRQCEALLVEAAQSFREAAVLADSGVVMRCEAPAPAAVAPPPER